MGTQFEDENWEIKGRGLHDPSFHDFCKWLVALKEDIWFFPFFNKSRLLVAMFLTGHIRL